MSEKRTLGDNESSFTRPPPLKKRILMEQQQRNTALVKTKES